MRSEEMRERKPIYVCRVCAGVSAGFKCIFCDGKSQTIIKYKRWRRDTKSARGLHHDEIRQFNRVNSNSDTGNSNN